MKNYEEQARRLQALAHPARLQILEILANGSYCVCELVMMTGKRQPYISQQMATLREVDLVTTERKGWNVYYQLNTSKLAELQTDFTKLSQPESAAVRGEERALQMGSSPWGVTPDVQIHWRPLLAAERCVGCGLCVTACDQDVYAFDYQVNKAVVLNPQRCIVGCSLCVALCNQSAVEIPAAGEIRQWSRDRRVLQQAKGLLKDNRPNYDVALRQAAGG